MYPGLPDDLEIAADNKIEIFSFVRQSRDRAYQFSLYSYAGDPTA